MHLGASKAPWPSGFPACHRRGRHQENIVRRALRSNELGCPLVIAFRSLQINRRISAIPNAIDPRFESREMPYAAFDSSDNQAVLGRPLTNGNCRGGRKLHHNASIEGKKVIRRIVDARTIDVHWVVSIQSDRQKFILDRPSRLRTTPMAALCNGCRLVRSWPNPEVRPVPVSRLPDLDANFPFRPGAAIRPLADPTAASKVQQSSG